MEAPSTFISSTPFWQFDYQWTQPKSYLALVPIVSIVMTVLQLKEAQKNLPTRPCPPDPTNFDNLQKANNAYNEDPALTRYRRICFWNFGGQIITAITCLALAILLSPLTPGLALGALILTETALCSSLYTYIKFLQHGLLQKVDIKPNQITIGSSPF